MVRIETDRLILRDSVASDLPNLHRLLSDKTIMYYLDDISTNSLQESEENLLHAMANADGHYFCVERKSDCAYIGQVGYTVTAQNPLGSIAHMGYFILPEWNNNGFTTEAVKRVISFAFEEDNYIRITTGCYKDNIASERVMRKAGFLKEGEHKKAQYHDGKMKDRVSYAINKDDYDSSAANSNR